MHNDGAVFLIGKNIFLRADYVPSDECYCPVEISSWLEAMKCPASYKQLDEDLSYFQSVNMTGVHAEFLRTFNNPGAQSVCHYVIKNNQVFRECFGEHVGFKMFVDAILLSLTRRIRLPDVEFYANLGDWPLVKPGSNFPLFSWCGSDDTADILWPTYDLTEATLQMLNRVTLDVFSAAANAEMPWEKREEKAFWRGRDSNRERLDLVRFSKRKPDIVDAGLTRMFFFRDQMHEFEPLSPHISFFDFFQYKYMVNVDGTVAAYRLPYLLAGASLVLKQDSKYYEHFYSELIPGEHYRRLQRDLGDLEARVREARRDDASARRVGLAGRRFVLERLHPQHVLCYHVLLLKGCLRVIQGNSAIFISSRRHSRHFGGCQQNSAR
ncbi:unnamed protein product, partial [Notodromas monacha]